ncbi:MAG: hypothetical protein ACRD4O_00615 [Bryobacteraceae bacterium]
MAGNVRQLEGAILKAVVLSSSDLIQPDDLELDEVAPELKLPEPADGFDMEAFLTTARAGLIERALAIANRNQSQAARLLGTTPQNISKFLKQRSKPG